ncbi:MAG: response regulator transcription factor [Ruminococcaceae bacterium]|jgi:DNA-binding NarL/FixJ family response regulator|nr:response regulator transcription factor [Oscillospiraceae bacterium]
MNKIRVLLADDQNIIREGIRSLLEDYADIEIVGEAVNGKQLTELAQTLEPDIILSDIRMPIMDGVQAARLIKQQRPQIIVIMLTTFDDDDYIIDAMTGGAAGYLLKDISSTQLVQALRDSMQGNLILPGRIAAKITARLATTTQSSAGKREGGRSNQNADINYDQSSKELNKQKEIFSERELDIVRLLQQGLSNREIADKLYLTVGTVKNYLSQIYLKLDVNDRANAVIRLRELEI